MAKWMNPGPCLVPWGGGFRWSSRTLWGLFSIDRGMMNKNELDIMRGKLNEMLEELETEVSTTLEGMRGDGATFPDPADRATMESDRNLTLRIRDRERKLKKKIEEALARVEDGTFGICEECEETIGFKRLEARPVTTLCINCKADQEEDEVKHKAG